MCVARVLKNDVENKRGIFKKDSEEYHDNREKHDNYVVKVLHFVVLELTGKESRFSTSGSA